VGGVWGICLQPATNPVINKLIHTYPHLIPKLGVLAWGELFDI